MGLATNSRIASRSVFARKNYFYPDLPKGYQISQYEEPICSEGFVEIDLEDGTRKRIGLTRIHIEEDAGKSIHDLDPDTLVDINRCGVPLLEIVSAPDMRSPREAYLFLYKIRQMVTYLGICDGNMEEGSLRCDANVSVRRSGEEVLGTKTEVKNMNSFRYVERALEFEIERQINILRDGGKIVQETLLWDAEQNLALPMRSKEEAHDYRYFPEPDLMPVFVDESWIAGVAATLPEHPTVRRDRFVSHYGLPRYDADLLTSEKRHADYYEATLKELASSKHEQAKMVSNWMMTEVLKVINERKICIDEFSIRPERFAGLLRLIFDGTISGKIGKEVFVEMLASPEEPKTIVERKGLVQITDQSAIEQIIDEIIKANPAEVEKYRGGNEKILGYFVGEVMKATRGKANPGLVNEVLRKKLVGVWSS